MKKLLILIVLVMAGSMLFAQLDPFMPPNPITFAQGGAFTAYAEGMNAFFYNPAGFRQERGELTLTSIGVYALIDESLLELAMNLNASPSISSRQSEVPAGLEGFEGLIDNVEDVGDWLGTLDTAGQDAAITAALDQIKTLDPELSDLVDQVQADIDAGAEPNIDAILPVLLESPILEEQAGGSSGLTSIIQAMDDASGSGYTTYYATNNPDDTNGWQDNVDSSVSAAKDSIPSGEMRFGALAGVAWSGNGLGFGLFVNADGTFKGETILSTKGRIINSITLVGGLSLPVGPFSIGAQIRPTILGYTDINPAVVLASLAGGENQDVDIMSLFGNTVYTGLYLGLDAGALYDLGPFTFGVAIKDLLPIPVRWSSYEGIEEYTQGLSGGNFFGPGELDEGTRVYQVPPLKINVGAQFNPNLGPLNWIVDPRVNVDIHDLLGFLRYINEDRDQATLGESYNIIERLRVGAQAAFLGGLATARAGFYGDYLNAGIGVHLLFLDVNAGVGLSQLEETDDGFAFQQLGVTFEAAIRF